MVNSQNTRQKSILYAQLMYAALVIIWNVSGVILIANGMRALGPTATLVGAGIVALLAVILVYSWRQNRWIYISVTILFDIGALIALYQAFSSDPSLWPSDFWRYCGIFINLFGVTVQSFAVSSQLALRSAHHKRQ